VGKPIVAGAKDHATNKISASKIEKTDRETLHEFVSSRVSDDSVVYTDDRRGYMGLSDKHESVKHSVV